MRSSTLQFRLTFWARSMSYFTPETVRGYLLDNFAPERMVFVGVNVAHSELTKWVMRYPALGPFGLEGPFGFFGPFW